MGAGPDLMGPEDFTVLGTRIKKKNTKLRTQKLGMNVNTYLE
jgi:hypothetical protein